VSQIFAQLHTELCKQKAVFSAIKMARYCQKLLQSAVQLLQRLLLKNFAAQINPHPLLSTHLPIQLIIMQKSAAHSAVLNALVLTKTCIAMHLQAILKMQILDYLAQQQTFHLLAQAINRKLLL
jgi:hypothetical protein